MLKLAEMPSLITEQIIREAPGETLAEMAKEIEGRAHGHEAQARTLLALAGKLRKELEKRSEQK